MYIYTHIHIILYMYISIICIYIYICCAVMGGDEDVDDEVFAVVDVVFWCFGVSASTVALPSLGGDDLIFGLLVVAVGGGVVLKSSSLLEVP